MRFRFATTLGTVCEAEETSTDVLTGMIRVGKIVVALRRFVNARSERGGLLSSRPRLSQLDM